MHIHYPDTTQPDDYKALVVGGFRRFTGNLVPLVFWSKLSDFLFRILTWYVQNKIGREVVTLPAQSII
jgi:hypothetical protein